VVRTFAAKVRTQPVISVPLGLTGQGICRLPPMGPAAGRNKAHQKLQYRLDFLVRGRYLSDHFRPYERNQVMPKSKLSFVPLAALQKEISRREKLLPRLIAQRDDLDRQIAELQRLTATASSEPASPKMAAKTKPSRRARNKLSLGDALAAFVAGKPKVSVAEAVQGVLDAGYKSKSKNFRAVVNRLLLIDKRFKKVGRGEFALKA